MTTENNIDNMTTEDLNAALKSEIDVIDGKAEASPEPDSETKPEPEKVEVEEPAKTGPESKTNEGVDGEEEGDGEGNPYRKRINRLLRKRDTLEETLAEKEARLAALEVENEQLKSSKQEETDVEENDIAKVIHKVLDDRDNKNKELSEKQKRQNSELDQLIKKVPNAANRRAEILEAAEKLPLLSFEAIDTMLAPSDHIDPIEVNRKNAKRMDISSRSRADLAQDKDMSKASTADQEKYLREQIAAGNLVI